jgi:serine/threonine protein phosphatase PrpC
MKGDVIMLGGSREMRRHQESSGSEGSKTLNLEKRRAEEWERQKAWDVEKKRLHQFVGVMTSREAIKKYGEIKGKVWEKYKVNEDNYNENNPKAVKAFKEINDVFENYLEARSIHKSVNELRESIFEDLIDSSKTMVKDVLENINVFYTKESQFPIEETNWHDCKQHLKEGYELIKNIVEYDRGAQERHKAWKMEQRRLGNFFDEGMLSKKDEGMLPKKDEEALMVYGKIKEKMFKEHKLEEFNYNEKNPVAVKAFKEINDEFENYLEARSIHKSIHELQAQVFGFISGPYKEEFNRVVETVDYKLEELQFYPEETNWHDCKQALEKHYNSVEELVRSDLKNKREEFFKVYGNFPRKLERDIKIAEIDKKIVSAMENKNFAAAYRSVNEFRACNEKLSREQEQQRHTELYAPEITVVRQSLNPSGQGDLGINRYRGDSQTGHEIIKASTSHSVDLGKIAEELSKINPVKEKFSWKVRARAMDVRNLLMCMPLEKHRSQRRNEQVEKLKNSMEEIQKKLPSLSVELQDKAAKVLESTIQGAKEYLEEFLKGYGKRNGREGRNQAEQIIGEMNDRLQEMNEFLNNPNDKIEHKRATRNLQETNDKIELIRYKKENINVCNRILEHIKNNNLNSHEIDKFKGCVEYAEEKFKTFIDENYIYTACNLIEELTHRSRKITHEFQIKGVELINIGNKLGNMRRRYSDYSEGISGLCIKDGKKPGEDSALVDDDHGVLAVFDGVSGRAQGTGGHIASAIAVDYLRQSLSQLSGKSVKDKMSDILKGIDRKIHDHRSGIYEDMATTASIAIVMEKGEGVCGNVGDSRVYGLKSDGQLEYITLDDGLLSLHKEDIANLKKDCIFANVLSKSIEEEYFSEEEQRRIQKKVADMNEEEIIALKEKYKKLGEECEKIEKASVAALKQAFKEDKRICDYLGIYLGEDSTKGYDDIPTNVLNEIANKNDDIISDFIKKEENLLEDMKIMFAIKFANVLNQTLGNGRAEPNIVEFNTKDFEWIVTSTDGVHDNLSGPEMARCVLENPTPTGAAQALTETAIENSLNPNRSRCKPGDDTSAVARRISRD